MTAAEIVATVLIAPAVALAMACAVGVFAMRDALQRLHYVTPVATLSAVLLGLALVVDDPTPAAVGKTIVIVGLLFVTNAVVSHATGRAVLVRRRGELPSGEDAP